MTAPAFDAWLDRFFASYYRQRPVNATFIGVHSYDDRLPDFSEPGMVAMLTDAEALLGQLRALPSEELSPGQALDRQLAEGFVQTQRWELRSAQFGCPLRNPTLVTGEAIFGVLGLLLRPFAPLHTRLVTAAARLAAVPSLIDGVVGSLRAGPRAWIVRARRECAAAQMLFETGLESLLQESGIEHRELRRAGRAASQAFGRFDTYLERELAPRATNDYACGAEAFDLLLRQAHFLDVDADELERLALYTLEAARDGAAGTESDLKASLPPGKTSGDVAGRCAELWRQAVQLAADADVLTLSDDFWPVRFREQPEWVRQAAPALYFLPYRAPAPFDATSATDCFVPQQADETTIKLNYVLHHASLGHHAQNWFAARADSRIGRMAAVDCASRIAMLCGGSMAEGWACYSVDLARDAGFLTPAESAEHDRTRRRMAARALVDIRLHQGQLSLADAVTLYQQHAGMSAAAAQAEAIKNSLFPGAACMYLVGWLGLWRLRRETQAREGRAFSLRAFHDRVLSFGSVPVTLVAQAVRASSTLAVQPHR